MKQNILLAIVEGGSDEIILNATLGKLMKSTGQEMLFHAVGSDVTKKSSRNAVENVIDEIRKHSKAYGDLPFTSYAGIVHIVDLDGAFIPDEAVMEDTGISKVNYRPDGITAKDRAKLIVQNRNKSESIKRLLDITHITKDDVPYRTYFVSCCLDHVFHNEMNLPDKKKVRYANRYVVNCISDPNIFTGTIACDHGCQSWEGSWQWAMQGLNSLQRATNLRFLLET